MKVGPIRIEKEFDHQLWRVELMLQNFSYYTTWYSPTKYSKSEAIEKFIVDTMSRIPTSRRYKYHEILEQARTALLFLEVSEMDQ